MMGVAMLTCAQLLWCSATGSISGVVHDASGAVVPGAEVDALNTETGLKRTATTDARGLLLVPGAASGNLRSGRHHDWVQTVSANRGPLGGQFGLNRGRPIASSAGEAGGHRLHYGRAGGDYH